MKEAKPKKSPLPSLYFDILKLKPKTSDVRQVKILQAVISICARDGVDELTFERIGKKTGMARSHVVYYFKDREELIESAMRFVAMTAQEIIVGKVKDGTGDWKDILKHYIESNFEWIEENPDHAAIFFLLYYRAAVKSRYRKLHYEFRNAGAKRIQAFLKLSPLNEKLIAPMSLAIQGMITGALIDATTTTDDRSRISQRKRETIDLICEWVERRSQENAS